MTTKNKNSAFQDMTARLLREDATQKQKEGLAKSVRKIRDRAEDARSPMQLFRRDMAKAGLHYVEKHGVSAAEAVCALAGITSYWAVRAARNVNCPSRCKGEKECKCVRH